MPHLAGQPEEHKKMWKTFNCLGGSKTETKSSGAKVSPHFLISISDGEQHAASPRGWISCDCDGEVLIERVGDEGLREAPHVSTWAEAVSGVTLKAGDEGDGGREGNAD